MRTSEVIRKTLETEIKVNILLDGTGKSEIDTGIPFFDHILTSFSRHGSFDIMIKAKGDLDVDDHHTIEDVGITLGCAIKNALGDKKGIERFGEANIPMDEALASVVIDISGRSYLVFNAEFSSQKIGNFSTQNTYHFFKSLTDNSGINSHINVIGKNDHHKIEAIFKAFGIALKRAMKITGSEIRSTKGKL